jgi:hypothetical protein
MNGYWKRRYKMKNYDMNRDRNWRGQENDNDEDWYYYEYRYIPYTTDWNSMNQGSNDWRSGPYAGMGPRGYQRSDERIKEDINERLTWHGGIDASDMQVDVKDAIVTLTGSANSRYEKRMTEDIIDGVPGVQDVNNNLSVNKQSRWDRSHRQGRMGMGNMQNNQIREGMDVVGRDGGNIGQVKEVRSDDFLVDRSMARDVYVPFDACRSTDGQIRLNIRADEVDNQNWPEPDLLGSGETSTSTSRNNR